MQYCSIGICIRVSGLKYFISAVTAKLFYSCLSLSSYVYSCLFFVYSLSILCLVLSIQYCMACSRGICIRISGLKYFISAVTTKTCLFLFSFVPFFLSHCLLSSCLLFLSLCSYSASCVVLGFQGTFRKFRSHFTLFFHPLSLFELDLFSFSDSFSPLIPFIRTYSPSIAPIQRCWPWTARNSEPMPMRRLTTVRFSTIPSKPQPYPE